MKKKYKKVLQRSFLVLISIVVLCVALFSRAILPAIEFMKTPVFTGSAVLKYSRPSYDKSKKTVVIIADKDGTEMFDMLAPYFLFNCTEKANVFIVAEKFEPIIVRKGLVVLPQFSFSQIDSMGIAVDVLVVPNQSVMVGMKQKNATVNFIKSHYNGSNRILSVCDGSATVASTGLYDGKMLTTHSSDYEQIKKQYGKPSWMQGVRVTHDGNLFSTAGVSNATEGSLTVIRDLFGEPAMKKAMDMVHYPGAEIKNDHRNLVVTGDAIFTAVKKGAFKSNERVGVLLENGINEFELAGVLDSYTRSFPASIESFSADGKPVISKYGLTILPIGDISTNACTELHLLNGVNASSVNAVFFPKAKLIRYDNGKYIIDACLQRIEELSGTEFAHTVKLMLDYN